MDVMGGEDSRIGGLPASAYVQAFAEGRCLELGRGNEEIAFGRAACLDVNAEIVEMAKSGPGCALYFTREGLVRLEASQAAFLQILHR